MAYFGPAQKAQDYFIDMGYVPAPRQTTADFLVSVTDPRARMSRKSSLTTLPKTAQEFSDYFKRSPLGQTNKAEIRAYHEEYVGNSAKADEYRHNVQNERATTALAGSPYTTSLLVQTRAAMIRRVEILRGNMLATSLNVL